MTVLPPSYLKPRLVLIYEHGVLPKQTFLQIGLIPIERPILDSDGEIKTCFCADPLDASNPAVKDEPLKRTFLAASDCGHAHARECSITWYSDHSRCPYCGVNHYDTDGDINQALEVSQDLFDMKQGFYNLYSSSSMVSDEKIRLEAPRLRHSVFFSQHTISSSQPAIRPRAHSTEPLAWLPLVTDA
ncbi:uncharacterized protein MYCFIDRAFT_78257 [Pseudocercospora fijiensis CIRAD86]|uniref:Uncharacterized protein n=1 Tax=Pseudocercospora fijiensis (strain CIRAD86) TaxID=383855 RepID=M3A7F5_PSEFD|nr:uncharacterized protein MYCFIDRAFT_78257 [Pseudocercospora fijiensis CIRAD86]EME80551.1 hypothetical protein MYCFIDRAFT_78257 [Pseudocercospora fijiensis CIRAD86]